MPDFYEFFKILAGRDPKALEQLLKWLEPWLRAVIRTRLAGQRLQGVGGVSDVFQSLMKDFVGRAKRETAGPGRSADAERYLAAAVQNKIRERIRRARHQPGNWAGWPEAQNSELSAEKIVEGNDFVASIRQRLDEDNQRLFDLRMRGFTWPELSGMVGGKSDALRMRLRRSVAAAIYHLNREEGADGG
jgi:hypothetical protein